MSESLRSVAQESATQRAQMGAEVPRPSAQHWENKLAKFRNWLSEKQQKEHFGHSYTHKKAKQRFAKAKDCDRHFVEEYDSFSTVFITYCNGVRDNSTSVVENANSFYPRNLIRKRREILKELGVYDDYAGVSLLAPKSGAEVPRPSAQQGEPYTHAHDFLWIPTTEVSEEDFTQLVEDYADSVEDFNVSQAVSVEHHVSEEVTTPFASETDRRRGDTTALPQELGRNLPLLDLSYEQGRFDASDAPLYVEKWCAALRLGSDGSTETKGVRRFRTLGSFHEAADTARQRRRSDDEESGAEVPRPSAPSLSEVEQQFVNQYLEQVGDTSEQQIEQQLERNIRRGKLPPDTDIQKVVRAIQQTGKL